MTKYEDTFEREEIEADPEAGAVILRPLSDFAAAPRREMILWRDLNKGDEVPWRWDAVVRVGDVAILAAPGGIGKSYLSLAWAAAAQEPDPSSGDDPAEQWGQACGMRIQAGPVVVVSYEDDPDDMARRVKDLNKADALPKIHAWEDPWPLWHHESGAGEQWAGLWERVKSLEARLVVIDPASVALDGPANDIGPVRAFLSGLRREAKAANCGVLLIAHDTKSARNQAKSRAEGFDPGAGAVAGSAAWYDAARCVMYLYWDPTDRDRRLLQVIKANHGTTGWGIGLKARRSQQTGDFEGLGQDGLALSAEDVDRAKADWAGAANQEKGGTMARRPSGARRASDTVDVDALDKALYEAQTTDAIVAALARSIFAADHDGAECPPERIPTEAAMLQRIAALSRVVYFDDDGAECPPERIPTEAAMVQRMGDMGPIPSLALDKLYPEEKIIHWLFLVIQLAGVHADWLALPEDERGEHPAAALVRAWQALPVEAELDRRQRVVVPISLRRGRLLSARRDSESLFDVGAFQVGAITAPAEQGHLPFGETERQRGNVVPVLPLQLYDGAGGTLQSRGGGAPMALRLFYQALTSVALEDRGHTRRLSFRLRELVAWIWPEVDPATDAIVLDRYDNPKTTWRPYRDLPRLQRGLWELDNLRMEWSGGLWRPVSVVNMPTRETDLDELLPFFDISHVPNSDRGPMIDRHRLQAYGKVSAAAFRSWISLAYLWDDVKAKAGGRRIFDTIPRVRTGRGGVLLDTGGNPITDAKTGQPVKNWSDRRAVPVLDAQGQQVRIRNPAADRIPELGPEDLAELAFGQTTGDRLQVANRARKARTALKKMQDAGAVTLEVDRRTGAFRILEPAPEDE